MGHGATANGGLWVRSYHTSVASSGSRAWYAYADTENTTKRRCR
jgi:hypothetical protein